MAKTGGRSRGEAKEGGSSSGEAATSFPQESVGENCDVDVDQIYSVHRFRFGNYVPAAIKSITSDPFSNRIAVGRIDGDVEICDSKNKMYVQVKVPGRKGFQLQTIEYSTAKEEAGRLFGISLRGFTFEIDMETLCIKNVRDSYGGIAWCMAMHKYKPHFAVGCEDGSAKIYRYDSNELDFVKSLPTTGSRVLCLSYLPRADASRLFLGCADGTVRCVDDTTGSSLFRMTGNIHRGAPAHIWSMRALSDYTVLTGDGRGCMQIWDGKMGVLLSSITEHTAEILALAASDDEQHIFASGVDGRVTCTSRLSTGRNNVGGDLDASGGQWVYTSSHRPHSHDVFALAFMKNHTPGGDRLRLISGGLDTKLCTYAVSDFFKLRPTWVLSIPAKGLVYSSSDHRTLAMKHRNHIDMWSLELAPVEAPAPPALRVKRKKVKFADESSSSSAGEKQLDLCDLKSSSPGGCKLSLRMELKDADHIHSVAMSPCGSLLAASSRTGTRLWSIARRGEGGLLAVSAHALPAQAQDFAHSLSFSADSSRLAMLSRKGQLVLLDTSGLAAGAGRLWHIFDHRANVLEAKLGGSGLEHVGAVMSFSSDGVYLALADGDCHVYVYELDRQRLLWRLPAFCAPVTSASFLPQAPSVLLVSLADNAIMTFDVEEMALSKWSTDTLSLLPASLRNMPSPVEGVIFGDKGGSFFLYGSTFCVYVDMNLEVPIDSKVISAAPQILSHNKKRKSKADRGDDKAKTKSNFTIITTYRGLIHLAALPQNQLVSLSFPVPHTSLFSSSCSSSSGSH